MSEIENNTNYEADEEISLIDLFSVLIRHRLMIILGTICVFVVAAGYLFLYPMIFPKASQRTITVKYSVSVASVPGTIAGELPAKIRDLKTVVNSEFNDLVFLVKELKKNNPFSDGTDTQLSDFQFNTYVQNLMKDRSISISASGIRDEIIMTLKIPEQNLSTATALVDSMVSTVDTLVEPVFIKEVEKLNKTKQETYDEMLKSYSDNQNISEAQTLLLTVRQIKEFLDDFHFIVKRELEPFVVLEPLGRAKKVVIATFAAFFIFVFIAFLINAIQNIKQDPEASEKIKTAWDNGKLSKK